VPTVRRNELRNVAIIAHVDHGKTTLVDGSRGRNRTARAGDLRPALKAEEKQERLIDSAKFVRVESSCGLA
jgi:predicted membrane GTPase involved in stress response